jgi:TonB family protein
MSRHARSHAVLAPEDDSRTLDSLKSSLASDIVELVVLTGDEAFLQTLREAVGPSRRLWHVLSSDKVGDMLLAGGVGILVLDVQALRQAGAPFITQIKQQFPDLVIVVSGNRDTEAELARLISEGVVYRFIHKPMSPARAKLFADAAVKRFEEQRRRSAVTTVTRVTPARNDRLMIIGGCAAIGAIAGGLWVLTRGHRQTPAVPAGTVASDTAASEFASDLRPGLDSELLARASQALAANRLVAPSGDNALELYLQAQARNPGNSDARLGIEAVRERLLARAANALMEDRLDEAAAAIETARRAGAPSGRISLLSAELAKSRVQGKAAADASRAKAAGAEDEVAAAPDPADHAAALAMQRIREGKLVEPDRDNARFYVQEALKADPGSNAAERASEALALGLLNAARGAMERKDFKSATALLDDADGVASPTNVDNLRHVLAAAERGADEAATAAKTAEQPAREERAATADDGRASAALEARSAAPAAVIDSSKLVIVKSVQPEYPRKARDASIEGWVELDYTVTESGRVKDLSVHAANPRDVFDQAAIAALSQWRYKPVLIDAKPVSQRARIRIRFALAR